MATGFGSRHGRNQPGPDSEPAGIGQWLAPLARHRWYSAIGATTALALIGGGTALWLSSSPGQPVHQLAADCGLVNCGAPLPVPVATTSPQIHISRSRPHHRRKSASPSPSASKKSQPKPTHSAGPTVRPSPTPPTPPPPPPPPHVTVTYSPSDHHHWGGFQGQLTIVNHSSQTVSGWNVQLAFPGDAVQWVGYPGGWNGTPFSNWQFSGGTLTMTANRGGEALGPGGSQTITIEGQGSTSSPSGCTFNGAACRSQGQPAPRDSRPGHARGMAAGSRLGWRLGRAH